MTAQDLQAKARRAVNSARLLLSSGDLDGACNRAYYAMFDAARAALCADDPGSLEGIKTHNGLITAFSLKLVKSGRVSIELGRALNKVEDLRLIADYRDEPLDAEHVTWAVDQASQFVEAIHRLLAQHR